MNLTLFDDQRLTLDRAIDLAIESLCHYFSRYRHVGIAYSGGKDSSALVTLVAYLIATGKIPQPETLTVIYADTRQELPPLHLAAMQILKELGDRGIQTRVVLPELDLRYFVYILGRGVPPPSNVFRWCTPKLKQMPMGWELELLRQEVGEKLLMLTGVRIGESVARDQRIALSCSKDGGECGQGLFQREPPSAVADTLAPIAHFRVCHVWDWLTLFAPNEGFTTEPIAKVYGMDVLDGEEPINARTGCFGCPLVQEDKALERVIAIPEWSYLAPLRKLRPFYWELHKPQYRHRKPGGESRKDGTLVSKQNRLGPLTLETRKWALAEVLGIEAEINQNADRLGRPRMSLINEEELSRIQELITAGTYPDKWNGTEPRGDTLLPKMFTDGSMQLLLEGLEL
jgi:DNA sulfur modification protein DndC